MKTHNVLAPPKSILKDPNAKPNTRKFVRLDLREETMPAMGSAKFQEILSLSKKSQKARTEAWNRSKLTVKKINKFKKIDVFPLKGITGT